ncbi:MAG: hypothetical protein Q8S26_13125 [Azonexus sp.]|nr:hypothetical protein [Azonexus sp.]
MDELSTLSSLGFSLPTPAYIIGAILFGLIGYAAYRYGKQKALNKVKWIGVALMIYPYAFPGRKCCMSLALRCVLSCMSGGNRR